MAEAIGTALARVSNPGTASQELSTVDWAQVDLTALIDLPNRLDDRRLEAVEAIARLPVPALAPAPEDHFLRCMRTLRLLPTRTDDDLSGELRLALYRKHFGRQPAEALSFLVEHATLECRFFPTPQECKAILDRWNRTDGPWRAHQLAQHRARQERQARFDDVMRRFQLGEVTQEEADALPERWRRIAATRGFLRDADLQLRPVRVWEEPEGQSPAVLDEQHTEATGKAGQPHERTDQ